MWFWRAVGWIMQYEYSERKVTQRWHTSAEASNGLVCQWGHIDSSVWICSFRFWVSLNLVLMSHILPSSQMRPPASRLEITSCLLQRLCPVRSVSRNATKHWHSSQSAVLFLLFGWKQEEIFLYIISIFCIYGRTGFFLSLSKQMLATNKIVTTGSSTTFVHTRHSSNHKMKSSLEGLYKVSWWRTVCCIATAFHCVQAANSVWMLMDSYKMLTFYIFKFSWDVQKLLQHYSCRQWVSLTR